jgi:methylmalonyl-CoA/ethylmalonyl-CoA epimerase
MTYSGTTLHQVAQHADDLGRAVTFYTAVLGASPIATYDPPGLAFVDLGGVRLLLESAAPSALVYLGVPDVRTEVDRLRAAGIQIHTEPHRVHVDSDGAFGDPGWEEWIAFIRDSEGNLVGLASRHAPPVATQR